MLAPRARKISDKCGRPHRTIRALIAFESGVADGGHERTGKQSTLAYGEHAENACSSWKSSPVDQQEGRNPAAQSTRAMGSELCQLPLAAVNVGREVGPGPQGCLSWRRSLTMVSQLKLLRPLTLCWLPRVGGHRCNRREKSEGAPRGFAQITPTQVAQVQQSVETRDVVRSCARLLTHSTGHGCIPEPRVGACETLFQLSLKT